MIEEWRPIPNYEGLYEISNYGKIRSLDRIIYRNNNKVFRKGKILKSITKTDGYATIELSKNGKTKHFYISRLVLTVFNRNAHIDEEACHFPDPNKLNNQIGNLIWGTAKLNAEHRDKDGNTCKGIKQKYHKLNEKQVEQIFLNTKNSQTELSKIYKVDRKTIYNIKNKKSWTHITNEIKQI